MVYETVHGARARGWSVNGIPVLACVKYRISLRLAHFAAAR